ncbi:MAG: DUF805 domain-containing protein [Faecalibacterium sp.]|jgi:uncharacterized membrane protein YhaH (DUF805 family)|nr:DUF805 domain-containing protein [Faecalibacterium sp.]
MEIFKEYFAMWNNYANFQDRTSLRGYWMAFLWNFVASLALGWIGTRTGATFFTTVYSLAVLVPTLAIEVRRLHDTGKHWAWIFINFVPIVGQIILIVFFCQPSVAPDGFPQV